MWQDKVIVSKFGFFNTNPGKKKKRGKELKNWGQAMLSF